MVIFVFILFAIAYIVTAKIYLLPSARDDIQAEYRIGNNVMKFYILSILPVMYLKDV